MASKKPPSRLVDGETVCGQTWGRPARVCTLKVGHLGWDDNNCFSAGPTFLDEAAAMRTFKARKIRASLQLASLTQLKAEISRREKAKGKK